jgi:hypothetical protein
MRGDEVLKTADGGRGGPRGGGRGRGGPGGGLIFGEDLYYLAFVGAPSTTDPWMLQFGGHHLAINLTMAGSQATMAPSLPAAQPATYTFEGRTVRPLGRENDKAFALINALDEKQRGQAILGFRVSDLVLGPGQDGRTIQPEGLRASAMTPAQQTMLLDIVHEWAGITADGDPRRPRRHVFRVERSDHQRRRRLFPRAGTRACDRVRTAGRRRSHPHHLPRSDERLRSQDCETVGDLSPRWRSSC